MIIIYQLGNVSFWTFHPLATQYLQRTLDLLMHLFRSSGQIEPAVSQIKRIKMSGLQKHFVPVELVLQQ